VMMHAHVLGESRRGTYGRF